MNLTPALQTEITSAICTFVAFASTCYRVYIRRGRFQADDAWPCLSAISLIVQLGAIFTKVPQPPRNVGVTRYYITAMTFYTTIWSARISILCSMRRIDPFPTRRKIIFGIAAVYFLIGILLMAQIFWVCIPEPNWKEGRIPQCNVRGQIVILQIVTDVLADIILLILPLTLFLTLQDKWLRTRLSLIFSTCIVTTIVSLVHAAYIFEDGGPKVTISALVEGAVSLIVCNIPVIVTHLIRLDHGHLVQKGVEMSSFSLAFAPTPAQTDQSILDSTLSEAKEEGSEGSGSHSVLIRMKGELQPESSNYLASQSESLLEQHAPSTPFILIVEPPRQEKPKL